MVTRCEEVFGGHHPLPHLSPGTEMAQKGSGSGRFPPNRWKPALQKHRGRHGIPSGTALNVAIAWEDANH